MREFRSYGSVRGAPSNRRPYRDTALHGVTESSHDAPGQSLVVRTLGTHQDSWLVRPERPLSKDSSGLVANRYGRATRGGPCSARMFSVI